MKSFKQENPSRTMKYHFQHRIYIKSVDLTSLVLYIIISLETITSPNLHNIVSIKSDKVKLCSVTKLPRREHFIIWRQQ